MSRALLPGRIYFFLLLAMNLNTYQSLLRGLVTPGVELAAPAWSVTADLVLSLVSLTGVFAYAFRRPIGFAALWRAWAFVQFVWDFYLNMVSGYSAEIAPVFPFIFMTALLPQYVMLYRLGSRWAGLFPGRK
jgi:hypothetical protein